MREPSLTLLKSQRSHVLFVLSNPKPGQEPTFLSWYRGAYRSAVLAAPGVLSAQHYEQHEIDITNGRCPRLPYRYLGLYELSIDGARAATVVIEKLDELHAAQSPAEPPATWLYYPANEKAGQSPNSIPSLLTIAFANGIPGRESEFREWYATRHVRHALNIPALVSGQCFERTQFQRPGSLEAQFSTIAVYEQIGTPEEMLESFASIPVSVFDFPALDVTRFAEAIYRPV